MRRIIVIGTAISLFAVVDATQLRAQRLGEHVQLAIPAQPLPRVPGGIPAVDAGPTVGSVPYVRDGYWYGHASPDDPRFKLARPFEFGHFALSGATHVYHVTNLDLGTRTVWLPGGEFQIAAFEWAATIEWCWTCDGFVVYEDPDHRGWYLMYDVARGEYVHGIFLGP